MLRKDRQKIEGRTGSDQQLEKGQNLKIPCTVSGKQGVRPFCTGLQKTARQLFGKGHPRHHSKENQEISPGHQLPEIVSDDAPSSDLQMRQLPSPGKSDSQSHQGCNKCRSNSCHCKAMGQIMMQDQQVIEASDRQALHCRNFNPYGGHQIKCHDDSYRPSPAGKVIDPRADAEYHPASYQLIKGAGDKGLCRSIETLLQYGKQFPFYGSRGKFPVIA